MVHKKRMVSACAALFMMFLLVPALNVSAAGRTQNDAVSWLRSQVGKTIDADKSCGVQCVDLIMAYYDYLGVSRARGNACDYITNALPSGWKRIKGAQPYPGDILLYSANPQNPYGHVSIYESDYVSYHENFGGHKYVEKVGYRYDLVSDYYWGVIRPAWSGGAFPSTWPFTSVTAASVTNRSATIAAQFESVNVQTAGFYLATSSGTLAKAYTVKVGKTCENLSFNLKECGVTLNAATTYRVKAFVTVRDVEYLSEEYTFRTSGSAAALKITSQPRSSSVILGQTVNLSVTATGSDLSYQWFYKKKGQTSWSNWVGHTSAGEVGKPDRSWDGILFYCKVTDGSGNSLNSSSATVNVLSIVSQSGNVVARMGDKIAFSVTATGKDLTYQWYYKKTWDRSFQTWNTRTHATETVTPVASWDCIQLYCKVTDSSGHSVASDVVTVSLLNITSNPVSASVRAGDAVSLSVTATGSGLSYQWYYQKKGQTSWSKWVGHTSASETGRPDASWDGIVFYCKVTDSSGHSLNSSSATITLVG